MTQRVAARQPLVDARTLIVKIGSALITNNGTGLDLNAINSWAQQLAELAANCRRILLVSSGAIACGMQQLGWQKRPSSIPELQAAAAVGQMGLAQTYQQAFGAHGIRTAQILLTHEDLADRTRCLNARATISTLLDLGVLPIINENDTVATDEIRFGDNDTLGALVANLIEADALVILTDQEGLYTADPRKDASATLVQQGAAGDEQYERMAGGSGTHVGTGGMITKIWAAKRAARSGAHTVIASGRAPNALPRLLQGEQLGTLLIASQPPLAARKQWLADHLQLAGRIQLDAGASKALRAGSNLLPVGVTLVDGEFERGAVVACLDEAGNEIARGLSNYASSEARRIAGCPSSEIEQRLGYLGAPELIHRDNLVIV
ncbi:MAG: Glutamate 5-kinase [Fluviibacter phosphoraccumulans EoVTN8]